MTIAQALLPEFDFEMANTRRTLERLPETKLNWKPDPKSMDLGRLAGHIAEMTGFAKVTMETDSVDMDPASYKPFIATSRDQLLREFDKNVAGSRAAIAGSNDEEMMKPWTFSAGGNVIFTMPRAAVLRSMMMSHIIHHRAQLTVYYRMNGVPVPGLYGPSADEGAPAAGSAAS